MKRRTRIIIVSIAGLILLPILFVLLILLGLFGRIQDKEDLLAFRNAEATIVLSADGEPIGKYFSQNRVNITAEQIPEHLKNALVATEDARFFEHKGIDTRSLFRVLVKTVILNNRKSGGGSTISQQLAKNMFGRKSYGPFSIIVNKSKEAILAYRLENTFSKEEILTLYLNTVPFGENIYGIEAASEKFFGKKTMNLRIEESAILVGMLKANTFYNPRLNPGNAIRRRNVVLKQMARYGYLSDNAADSLSALELILHNNGLGQAGYADYFLVEVRREAERLLREDEARTGKDWNIEEDGLIITTTLDLELQKLAMASIREQLGKMQQRLVDQYSTRSGRSELEEITTGEIKRLRLEGRQNLVTLQEVFDWKGTRLDSMTVRDSLKRSLLVLHAGLLAIDPSNGAIRSWIGGIDFKTQPYDQILARRQLASVFKPFIFAEAFEEGMEPCQYLENDSITLSEYNNWSPENSDHSFGGRYSLAGALAHSMNLPTLSLYLDIGFSRIDSLWRRFGFSFELKDNPSIALGTAEASILEVALAYSVFANGGFRIKPEIINSITTPDGTVIYKNDFIPRNETIIASRTSHLVNAILQKATREGTGASMKSVFNVDIPLAGKTGTSQDYSDAWFTAYNPALAFVTRVGASTRSVHFNDGTNGSGAALALPVIALTCQKIQSDSALMNRYSRDFAPLPPELEGVMDCPDYKDNKLLFRIIDIFRKKEPSIRKVEPRQRTKKKSLFDRLFK
ncbi:MAG: transglycosylase domain-containing protein [Bacteroidales bacterium]